MISGSCCCGKIKVEFDGVPAAVALCHCTDCRKISGSPFTYNFIAKRSELNVIGTPKEIAKVADNGNRVTNYFCPDCGSPLYGGSLSADGALESLIIRAGVFDDVKMLSKSKPIVEIYVAQRLDWVAPIADCQQFNAMFPAS